MFGFIFSLLIGALAGSIAGRIMGSETSALRNIVLGILGSFVGGILFGLVGLSATGLVGEIIVSVIGANGAGKSTLMDTIAGVHKPTAGTITFKGEDITGMPAEKVVLRGLSLVPQGSRCFIRMTVEDNLVMGSYPKAARAKVKDSLERVYELFPVLKEKRNDLSGSGPHHYPGYLCPHQADQRRGHDRGAGGTGHQAGDQDRRDQSRHAQGQGGPVRPFCGAG